MVISIDKTVIFVHHGEIFDAVTGRNIDLHAIIRHKKVTSAAHDRMMGIIEKIIHIEKKYILLIQIILKIIRLQIDRCFDI